MVAAHFPLTRHSLELHQELHARPALPARSPCVVSYWIQHGMAGEVADAALLQLCRSVGAAEPMPGVRHARVQGPQWQLKFERHGEFVSWQVNRPLDLQPLQGDEPLQRQQLQAIDALQELPAAFLQCLAGPDAGQMLAAAHVLLLDARHEEGAATRLARLLRGASSQGDDSAALMGATIGDGRSAALLTPLQLGADGFTRYYVLDFDLPPDQAAREAQRLCEIEAYRMLAMLGFPLAQQEAQRLGALEQELQTAVDAMSQAGAGGDDSQAFAALTRLAAEAEHAAARTRYRFSATRAYHAIVQQRLADLREQRMPGVQTLGGFLARRFAPAMAFVESTERRLSDLGERVNRALALARVRIEAQREQHNQELLRLQAERQHEQLRLQRTVEGLSVVAISYYALGLVGYMAKALQKLPGLPAWVPGADALVAMAVLPVLAMVAWGLRSLRRHA